MIIVGFVLLAAAVVVAVALVVQNPATVTVHAFKWSWDVDLRWVIVAGLALTAIGLVGLAMMRLGGAHYARLRRERKALAYENKRLVAEQANPAEPAPGGPPAGYAQRPVAPPARPAAEQPTQTMPPAARPAPPTAPQRPVARPPESGRNAAAPAGGVAAPEREVSASTEPHGFRERLAAARHRHVKE